MVKMTPPSIIRTLLPTALLFSVCEFCAAATLAESHADSENEQAWDSLNNSMVDLSSRGLRLIEGDLAIPAHSEDTATSPLLRKSTAFLWRRWPGKTVYYDFHSSVNKNVQGVILEAIQHWEEQTCLRFRRASLINLWYINFRTDSQGCWSQVGMETLGAQDLNLGPGCEFTQVVIHELGHAVGFFHEQSRSDRDSSVLILWENVPRETYSQFTHTYDINYDVPYDVTSVMQYSQSAFSPDPYEKNTIVTLDPHMQLRMGNKQLSFRDRKLANLMYSCSDSCPNIVDLKCENEGFLFKAATAPASEPCTCVCPHNSRGERCEDLTESYYGVPSCGGNITSEGTFETPGFPNRDVNYESCTWWIQAPEGQVAQLTFDEFSFASRLDAPSNKYDGKCVYERVEVRLRDRYRGEMYCGTDIKPGQQMSSRTPDAVIIVSRKRSMEGKGLRATVHFVHNNGMVDGIQNIVSGAISSASNLVSAQMTGK